MKTNRKTLALGAGLVVMMLGVWGLSQLVLKANQPNPHLYSFLCGSTATGDITETKWKVMIYLDVDACISCTEDMEAWKQLERELPDYGGVLTLCAPAQDSLDVAVAMELEGLNTPVRVIDSTTLASLNWLGSRTPIKLLLDSNCQPKRIIKPMRNLEESRQLIEKLLAEIRLENRETT